MTKSRFAILAVILASLVLGTLSLCWAEDGAALYKANCAVCHKPDATGNPAMKSPAIKGKTLADVKKAMTSDPKHSTVSKKLNDDQLKAIADYLGTLK